MTFNAGLRYEFFGLPTEVNGRIGNVDFEALTDTDNPVDAFIVPNNVQNTGFAAVDAAIAASEGRTTTIRSRGRTGTTSRRAWDSPGTRTIGGWFEAATASSTTARRRRS